MSEAKTINNVKRRKYFDIYRLALLKMVMKTIHIQCNEVLQNCSMSPSKLLSHFETEDGENKGKLLLYWTSEFDDWLK